VVTFTSLLIITGEHVTQGTDNFSYFCIIDKNNTDTPVILLCCMPLCENFCMKFSTDRLSYCVCEHWTIILIALVCHHSGCVTAADNGTTGKDTYLLVLSYYRWTSDGVGALMNWLTWTRAKYTSWKKCQKCLWNIPSP